MDKPHPGKGAAATHHPPLRVLEALLAEALDDFETREGLWVRGLSLTRHQGQIRVYVMTSGPDYDPGRGT